MSATPDNLTAGLAQILNLSENELSEEFAVAHKGPVGADYEATINKVRDLAAQLQQVGINVIVYDEIPTGDFRMEAIFPKDVRFHCHLTNPHGSFIGVSVSKTDSVSQRILSGNYDPSMIKKLETDMAKAIGTIKEEAGISPFETTNNTPEINAVYH
ncbi:MAG: hypothetical protein WBK77_02050 [Alphaproteobacteria bacterium]